MQLKSTVLRAARLLSFALSFPMAYPSSLSDYWYSVQWGSLTSSLPTDPRACLTSISASSFCCLPYLPFWPFSRFTGYSDLDVDDDISTSSSTWQPPASALSSFSSSSSSALLVAPPPSSSSYPASVSSSTALRVSQPIAQPVFSSHLASSTFSSPAQLASILVRQQDEQVDSTRYRGGDGERKQKDDDRAAHAMASDMCKSQKQPHSSKSKKRPHKEQGGREKERKRREESERGREREKERTKPSSVPRSALSSSPVSVLHSIHQDEDMSDSDLSDLSSDDEQLLKMDRHERALGASFSKPAAIY